MAAAAADYRAALERAVDNNNALHRLVGCGRSHAERVAALEFIHAQLVKQTTFGGGLLAYREAAHGVLDASAVLDNLRAAHAARPDLVQAWSRW